MVLVERKDPAAFEILYDRHGGAAYSLAHRIVGSPEAAEDVVQEAFLSIWRSGARFDSARGSVRSWTLGVVRNRSIDALRRQSGKAPKLDFDDDATLEAQHSGELTDSEAIRRDTASRVRGALRELPGRAVGGDRPRLLRRLHPLRDRRDAQHAAGYRQGADAPGAREGPPAPRRGDGHLATRPRHCHERPSANIATSSPPTRWALSSTAEKLEVERHLAGCEECREYLLWLDPAVDLLPASVEPRTPPAAPQARADGARSSADLKAERRAEKDRKRSERGLWGTIWRPVTAGVLSDRPRRRRHRRLAPAAATSPRARPSRRRVLPRSAPEMEATPRGPGRSRAPSTWSSCPACRPNRTTRRGSSATARWSPSTHLRRPRGRRGGDRGLARRRRRRLHHPRARGRLRGADRARSSWASSCPERPGRVPSSRFGRRWPPATGIRIGRRTSPAPTAGGRSARTA